MTSDDEARPKVVALMPAWNAESFITPVLVSWANQTYPNLQVLISDDASTDRTAEICAEFAENLSNVELIRQPQRLGWIGNTNTLLGKADGEYFVFAAHDDIPEPSYIERLVTALEGNPRAVLSFSDFRWRDGINNSVLMERVAYRDLDGVTDRLERGVRVARWWRGSPNLVTIAYGGVFRASAARQVGGLRRHIAGENGADWPWLLHLSLLGEFVRIPETLLDKVYWPTSASSSWKPSLWRRFGVWTSCFVVSGKANLTFQERFRIRRELVAYPLKRLYWRNLKWIGR